MRNLDHKIYNEKLALVTNTKLTLQSSEIGNYLFVSLNFAFHVFLLPFFNSNDQKLWQKMTTTQNGEKIYGTKSIQKIIIMCP